MDVIKIKKYSDVNNLNKEILKRSFTVDLKELQIKEKAKVIDFLNGLTFLNGSIKKINKDQFQIIVDKDESPFYHKNPYYEDLDVEVKKGLEKKRKFDSHKPYPDAVPSKRLLNEYNVQIDYDKISYITMDTFNHIIVLTKDNKLYIDNILYKEKVIKIIEFTKTDLIFIFENNEVEYYSKKNSIIKECRKYDKVLYTDEFLATLKEKRLVVYYTVTVADNCLFIEDETFDIDFWDIDDISLKEEVLEEGKIIYLNMEKNKVEISSPFIVGKLS